MVEFAGCWEKSSQNFECEKLNIARKEKVESKLLVLPSLSPPSLLVVTVLLVALFLSDCDWQLGYIHAISPSARSYSLLEPSSAGQINLPCQREGGPAWANQQVIRPGVGGVRGHSHGAIASLIGFNQRPAARTAGSWAAVSANQRIPQWDMNSHHTHAHTHTNKYTAEADWCLYTHTLKSLTALHAHTLKQDIHKSAQRDTGNRNEQHNW